MTVTVFTNGCFDILHAGHVDLLGRARALGDRLVVGINSDRSVTQIKGPGRPFVDQESRKQILLGLRAVDDVIIFDDLTPEDTIKKVKPDVLVKGGDWKLNEIIGSEFVTQNGGKVLSLPLFGEYSSSSIAAKIEAKDDSQSRQSSDTISVALSEHADVIKKVLVGNRESIDECGRILINTFRKGGKILICGNGGSAADAQHIAAEFVGRYETERAALPAIALTTDTSALTALANDYDFERIFARQIEGLAVEGDCLIAISTSGNSPNIIAAVMEARRRGCKIVSMTGANGKKLASLSDGCFMAPSVRTARIQEAHITVAHIWCELVDVEFTS